MLFDPTSPPQVELSVEYPAISPSDGVEIKSSWKLIHNEKTPFGCVLWLSIVAQHGEHRVTDM